MPERHSGNEGYLAWKTTVAARNRDVGAWWKLWSSARPTHPLAVAVAVDQASHSDATRATTRAALHAPASPFPDTDERAGPASCSAHPTRVSHLPLLGSSQLLAPPALSSPWPMAVGAGPCLVAVVLSAAWISSSSSSSEAAASSAAAEQGGTSHRSVNCVPCSRTYIGDADLDTLTGQLARRHGLAEMSDSGELCKGLADDVEVPTLSKLHRQLVGEGSHRRLVYSVEFGACQGAMVNFLDGYDAHLVIIEKLPNGVFADPFELQHFVERKVFLDVAVFGDTNLELPTALSNQSSVEIHFDLRPSTLTNCNLVIDLPLHARYPPLDASGYATVEFGCPNLLLRYRKKEIISDSCLWVLKNCEAALAEKAAWRIPCGDERHIGFVSSITFLSALICSMSIVLAVLIF
ncbi:hypothetical protein U9M48_037313 [Paspalum notatum var. saurae]|uniref:Phosphatidylinositol-glycan biosynthesis class X protein n=1 Tax=Paspalum notatum var. saurae TaxID=547442 RepID=A0AAQ3UG65_PASNO